MHKIQCDGNCLFRGLCYGVVGSQINHRKIHWVTTYHISGRGTYNGVNDEANWNDSRMRNSTIYGTGKTSAAAVQIL